MAHNSTTSIDVGSMFLMDLSVHESDSINEQNDPIELGTDSIYSVGLNYRQTNENRSNYANQSSLSTTQSIVHHRRDNQQQQRDYSGNSLDGLACVSDDRGRYKKATPAGKQSNLVTIVEPQPPPELIEHQSSSSLSDESYVASDGNSLSESYSASSEAEGYDRGSTTTREDSGVLDMKDLDSQLNNSYDFEHVEGDCQRKQNQQQLLQEKPISNSTKATNLINKSINNYDRSSSYVTTSHHNQPTNYNSSNCSSNNNHHHQNNRSQSKRSVSASLPIQVPVRQMKKDLKKSKLNMIIKNTTATSSTRNDDLDSKSSSVNRFYNNHSAAMPAGVDDFEEFLEQEYNDNHHNHYPIDEYDEHMRADENPMKLFESIQALARSLHEDTELFGSLPPKRMLESPIRPLALV